MINIIRNNKLSFLIVSICIFFVIILSGLVIIYDELLIDSMVYEFLMNNFSCEFIDQFMINITKLGDTKFVILFTGIIFLGLLFSLKKFTLPVIFVGCVSGITFINQVLKFSVKRVRPDINRLIEIGGYSFPSGHSMVSVVLYGFISYLIFKFVKNKIIRNSLIFLSILIVLLIGISRIYIGVHFFSDVVVGFMLSVIFLVIVINILEKKLFSQN